MAIEELENLKILISDEVTHKVFPDYHVRTQADYDHTGKALRVALTPHLEDVSEMLKNKSLPELHKDKSFLEFKEGMTSELVRKMTPEGGRAIYHAEVKAFHELDRKLRNTDGSYKVLLNEELPRTETDRRNLTVHYHDEKGALSVIDPRMMGAHEYKEAVEKLSDSYTKSNLKENTVKERLSNTEVFSDKIFNNLVKQIQDDIKKSPTFFNKKIDNEKALSISFNIPRSEWQGGVISIDKVEGNISFSSKSFLGELRAGVDLEKLSYFKEHLYSDVSKAVINHSEIMKAGGPKAYIDGLPKTETWQPYDDGKFKLASNLLEVEENQKRFERDRTKTLETSQGRAIKNHQPHSGEQRVKRIVSKSRVSGMQL